jgi:hypothetical protein
MALRDMQDAIDNYLNQDKRKPAIYVKPGKR